MIVEIWKDIQNYEGQYQVSNLGRIKSLKYGKEKILKQQHNNYGYVYVLLSKNCKPKQQYVHRLVAKAFVQNPDNYNEVNHIDESKENNCFQNLEWCCHGHNINYGTRNERASKSMMGKRGRTKLTETDVIYIREHYIPKSKDFNTRTLAEKFGVSDSAIGYVVSGKTWRDLKNVNL